MIPVQAITIVSSGGTPMQIADQRGAPYPTTGHGALVFNTAPHLIDAYLHYPKIIGTIEGVAPVDSPVFTGDPQTPTPPPGDNDQSIPNTLWVQNEIDMAIASAPPGAWDDITGKPSTFPPTIPVGSEIANWPFLPLTGGTMTGPINGTTGSFTGSLSFLTMPQGDNSTAGATTAFVTTAIASALSGGQFLPITGGELTGPLLGTTISHGVGGYFTSAGTDPLRLTAAGTTILFRTNGPATSSVVQMAATEFSSSTDGGVSLGLTVRKWSNLWTMQANIDGAAGTTRPLRFDTAGVRRWEFNANASAESGSNVGSDFNLARFSDAGASLGTVMTIGRSSGSMSYAGHIYPTTDKTYALGLATNRWTTLQTQGINLSDDAGTGTRTITFRSGTSARWNIVTSSTAESGSNVGSDFRIDRYTDAGGIIDSPIFIGRSTGIVNFQAGPPIWTTPTAGDNTTKGATTAFVNTALGSYVQTANLNESIDDRVAALAVAGANMTITYNDTANTLTFASTGGGGGISEAPNDGQQYARQSLGWSVVSGATPEQIDDRVAALCVAGANMTINYDDIANTLTFASSAAGGGGGTVTTVSVVSANGFAGTVATNTTTPAITMRTSITGLLKGDGTGMSAAVAGTDYMTPGNVSAAYQPLDSDLTALAGLNATAGLVEQTGAAAYTKRLIGVANGTDIPTRAQADARYAPISVVGTVTSVTGTAPVVSSGGATPAISMAAATSSVNGYLTSTDWSTFNGKAPLASPAFTGTPTAPTATAGTSTTQIASTAFVGAAITALNLGTTYQPLDATLTALAGLNATAGLLEQTGADAFTKRAIGGAAATDILTRAAGDARYLMLSGGSMTGTITARDIVPYFNLAYALGGPSLQWSNVYAVAGTFSGSVGVNGGAVSSGMPFHVNFITDGDLALFSGSTKGVRIKTDSLATYIEGVDNTGVGSFQPLVLAGLTVHAPTPLAASNSTEIATTAWVKANVVGGAVISDTPPSSPAVGQIWWESDTGISWIYYNDGTSSQWVQMSGGAGAGTPITVGTVAPSSPAVGALWVDTN